MLILLFCFVLLIKETHNFTVKNEEIERKLAYIACHLVSMFISDFFCPKQVKQISF